MGGGAPRRPKKGGGAPRRSKMGGGAPRRPKMGGGAPRRSKMRLSGAPRRPETTKYSACGANTMPHALFALMPVSLLLAHPSCDPHVITRALVITCGSQLGWASNKLTGMRANRAWGIVFAPQALYFVVSGRRGAPLKRILERRGAPPPILGRRGAPPPILERRGAPPPFLGRRGAPPPISAPKWTQL